MIEISIWYPVSRLIDSLGRPAEPARAKLKIEFVVPKRPFLFWATQQEYESIQYPKGYGVAWRMWEKQELLFAPIPFNIVVGWLIFTYSWLRIGFAVWIYEHTPRIRKK